jgi:hypothetical protein
MKALHLLTVKAPLLKKSRQLRGRRQFLLVLVRNKGMKFIPRDSFVMFSIRSRV